MRPRRGAALDRPPPAGRLRGRAVTTGERYGDAALADELRALADRFTGGRAYTARLAVDLRAPAPSAWLPLHAWREAVNGRKITIRADGRSDEGLFVEAEALFVAPVIAT